MWGGGITHFVVVLLEDGVIDDDTEVLLVAFCEVEHSLCIPGWGVQEAFTVGVFSYAFENCPNTVLH